MYSSSDLLGKALQSCASAICDLARCHFITFGNTSIAHFMAKSRLRADLHRIISPPLTARAFGGRLSRGFLMGPLP
jgi:hypothetical protein